MDSKFLKRIITVVIITSFFNLFFCHTIYALPTDPVTETVSISAIVGEVVVVTPGGGTTSGGIVIPKTAVVFSGYAYPNANVTLLKLGEKKAVVKANELGYFSITLEEIYSTNILYSLFAEDIRGNRSLLINYPIAVKVGYLTQLTGIRFAPTIVTDKSEVKTGDYLTVSGYALPGKELELTITGLGERIFTLTSSQDGSYKIIVPTGILPKGEYVVSVRYANDLRVSKFIKFIIGDSNVLYTDALSNIPGDCNADKIINLVDFSILAFWYGKNNPPVCVDTNGDKIINLVDFSILAFHWTG